MKCVECDKTLRLIGNERKNGKSINNTNGKDWGTRKYHKKCWKLIKEREREEARVAEYFNSPQEKG